MTLPDTHPAQGGQQLRGASVNHPVTFPRWADLGLSKEKPLTQKLT